MLAGPVRAIPLVKQPATFWVMWFFLPWNRRISPIVTSDKHSAWNWKKQDWSHCLVRTIWYLCSMHVSVLQRLPSLLGRRLYHLHDVGRPVQTRDWWSLWSRRTSFWAGWNVQNPFQSASPTLGSKHGRSATDCEGKPWYWPEGVGSYSRSSRTARICCNRRHDRPGTDWTWCGKGISRFTGHSVDTLTDPLAIFHIKIYHGKKTIEHIRDLVSIPVETIDLKSMWNACFVIHW